MSDRPILFSGPMVRALLDGRKTQTRRIIPQPEMTAFGWNVPWQVGGGVVFSDQSTPELVAAELLNGVRIQVGDRLYVREAHAIVPRTAYRCSEGVEQVLRPDDDHDAAIFRCGWDRSIPKWRPGIHMPRWASRLTLTVTDVQVQRIQEITEADAMAEGIALAGAYEDCDGDPRLDGRPYQETAFHHEPASLKSEADLRRCACTAVGAFRHLWNSLNADRGYGWDANPWVTVTTFSVDRRNIDEVQP
ncbi:hypothetical protein [Aminobacter aminovorans]|uniref:hypothetical protein n=1 Tax=Aminobacter aminovorans TaxID=83263 RepID=UPI002866B9D9|nr:hypothetical protein [Aminobacter aminovorans]MDR7220322.1 hypothetical protein [Aminobacter aminovorans]